MKQEINESEKFLTKEEIFELAHSKYGYPTDDISLDEGVTYIRYNESNTRYYVPVDMKDTFDSAIDAYNAVYNK